MVRRSSEWTHFHQHPLPSRFILNFFFSFFLFFLTWMFDCRVRWSELFLLWYVRLRERYNAFYTHWKSRDIFKYYFSCWGTKFSTIFTFFISLESIVCIFSSFLESKLSAFWGHRWSIVQISIHRFGRHSEFIFNRFSFCDRNHDGCVYVYSDCWEQNFCEYHPIRFNFFYWTNGCHKNCIPINQFLP